MVALGVACPCVGQESPGPATLENLVNSDEAKGPDAVPEAEAPPAGPKRPAGTVTRPKDGVQHPDLDKAWAEYDAVVTNAAEGIRAALTKQFDAATAKGDLDAAEKWQAALEKFEKAGEVPSQSEAKSAVSAAVADYKKAREELSKAYESVVKSLTMEKKIAEAKTARDEWLRCTPVAGQSGGLLGEYFADANLKAKVRENVDEVIAFDWVGGAPHGLPNDGFSIRWSGSLLPPETGDYVIIGNSDDGVRIAIDGRVVVDLWRGRFGEFRSAPINLTQGKKHKLVVEYCELIKAANVKLEWIKPDGTRQLIPRESLVPSRAARGR